ncbi:FAD-dependent oxidoreductase [Kribbella qitaiheensis]|uniref:FAD-dependent oxidoreductase n=1 Tax=Kribbella qitaiheensis TaxID=1544730 RepID=A0A7G6WZG8_9ACTN|nr:FAD-dependent oxidoreductase [Kribbella qitaiheensis]QNE19383.1 FAD-dependent oxidoreductase [Kribbella qitaiheensis]
MSPYLRSFEGDPAQPRPQEPISVVVDGAPTEALPGQTVAAVLMAAGRESWRTTRTAGRPRGVFCGIGACFDCLVVVNGTPDVRACQRTIAPDDTITTQTGAVLPNRVLASEQPRGRTLASSDAGVVVVVGGGPAGVAAAVVAADAGVEVVLVDAGRRLGGQFHRQLPAEFNAGKPERLQHGWGSFKRLLDRINGHERIDVLGETSVWAIESRADSYRLWLQTGPADAAGRKIRAVDAKAVVLATGAYDRVLPFPGWDLPGVYSAGAAQALAKGQRIAVGRKVLLAGTGPFLLPVAESLLGVGAEVVGLLEANRLTRSARGWLSDPRVLPGKTREAIAYAALLARHRIPFLQGRTVIAAHGSDRVEGVTTAKLDKSWHPIPGTERDLEVDAVCLGFGFTAQLELAVSAGCELGPGPDGGSAAQVDEYQQTSRPGVFAAGELTGIGGADLAAAEGRLAGAAAAHLLGTTSGTAPTASKQVAKGKRFAAALAKAYPIQPGWRSWSGGTTVVCRCEEVTRGQIEEAVADRDVTGQRSLKLTSRAGLGLCQGRVCSRTTADLTGIQAGHRRPIAVPVRLQDLAAIQEDL